MISKTYLLYSDERVDLIEEANKLINKIYDELDILKNDQDIRFFSDIKISTVRDIIEKSIESSYSGIKVFVLNLETIKIEAISALLKIIEEPPKGTVFILLSKNLKLPSTILSRAIKMKITPKIYDIDNNIYDFFDGKSKYLDEYIKNSNINLSDYIIENIDDTIKAILQFYKEDNFYTKINYEQAIRYIVNEIKYSNSLDKLNFIQEIIDIFSNDRENTINFLNKILLVSKNKLNYEIYLKLVNLKNRIKNNVSTKYTIYIFFNILFEEE